MMKMIIFLTLILLVFPITSKAELSNNAIDSIGKFLVMDFQSISDKSTMKPLSNSFIVKEMGDSIFITKNEILSVHGLDKIRDKLISGQYRRITIINEVTGIGCIVRDAFIDNQNKIYWSDYSQSLLKYRKRPELGNTGVVKMMDYENPNILADMLRNAKRGVLPETWQPTADELDIYTASINVIHTLLINRP